MSMVEVKEQLVNKILTIGINSEFRNNPSFGDVLGKVINSIPSEGSQVLMTDKDGKIIITFKDTDGYNNKITIDCSSPNVIHCMQSLSNNSPSKRTMVEQKIELFGGSLEFHQNEAEKEATNGIEFIQQSRSFRERYDKTGIMTHRKQMIFKPFRWSDSIDIDNDMLAYPRGTTFYNSQIVEFYLQLDRRSHDVARVVSQGTNNYGEDMTYEGFMLVDCVNLPPLTNIRGMRDNYPGLSQKITPKSDEELYHDLVMSNLTPSQIRFLIELSNSYDRKNFSFEPTKIGRGRK